MREFLARSDLGMFWWVSYVFALTVLTYASICDLKTREVSNRLWVAAWPAGFALSVLNIVFGDLTVSALAISAGISVILGVPTAYFGLFGGADMKALIFIGLTVPAYPRGMRMFLGDPIGIPAVTVIMNAYIFCIFYPLAIFSANALDMLRRRSIFSGVEAGLMDKAILMFTTRKVSLESLERGLHYFPAEVLVEEGGRIFRKPVRLIHAEANLEPILEKIRGNRHLFRDGVLASPTIPLLIPFTIALLLLPLGNIPLWVAGKLISLLS